MPERFSWGLSDASACRRQVRAVWPTAFAGLAPGRIYLTYGPINRQAWKRILTDKKK